MAARILLLGKDGQVGWELQRALAPLGAVFACGRREVDFEQPGALAARVAEVQPTVIVNAAAYTAVDKAETDVERAGRINGAAVAELAQAAARQGAWLVHYSTDYVFDGRGSRPWKEDDPVHPLSVYGRTKLEGEEAIRSAGGRHFIFRTSWVFAERGGNFARTMLRLAGEREQLSVIADQFGAPTCAALIADVTALALYRLALDHTLAAGASGTYHLAASGETSWHGYAQYLVAQALESGASLKASPDSIAAIPTEAYPLPARRPANSRLDTGKLERTFGIVMPAWQHHVQRVVRGWVG